MEEVAVKFGEPMWLWAVPGCLLALGLLYAVATRRRTKALQNAFNTPLLARLVRSVDMRWRWFKWACIALGCCAVLVALARPQWGRNEVEVERTGVDLIIALDVSRSMLAADADGTNRLQAAKSAVSRLIGSMGGDRVGLVAFAGEAFVAAPLTRDHVAFERALRSVRPSSVSEQGSNPGKAIDKAAESFDRAAQGTRALLVLSDGEQLQGDVIEAARKAKRLGIRLHTAGVGSEVGARIPAEGYSKFVRNMLGREVITRRNEQKLRQAASAGGGMYTRIDERDSRALAQWFQVVVATMPRSTEKRVLNEPRERYQWPLAVALCILMAEWMMSDRRKKRGDPQRLRNAPGRIITSLKVMIAFWTLLFAQSTFAGMSAWDIYNQGVDAYAKADYPKALEQWQTLAGQSIPRGLQRPVWFQLGNVHFRMGEPLEKEAPEQAVELWTRSCDAYRSALEISPKNPETRHNLAIAERRLATLLDRLGMDTFRAAESKPMDQAIELLRDSVEQLERATVLQPDDGEIAAHYKQASRALRERLQSRAEKSERKADDLVKQNNSWSEEQAEEDYQLALQDLADARKPAALASATSKEDATSDALDKTLAQAEERVRQKLSDLHTRRGQREQKQGDASSNPDQKLEHYETALGHYQDALEAKASNSQAQKGEREVRDAMEKLRVEQGKAELQRGKKELAQESPRAAQALESAVTHFESALQMNANNEEAKAGVEEAKRLLPEALNLAGQAALKSGDRAESLSASEAMPHYQEAEKDFQQSLELKKNQAKAEKGLKEAQEKLAKAQKRAEQEAETAAKAGQGKPKELKNLLGQVGEKERAPEFQRERQKGARNFGRRPQREDW